MADVSVICPDGNWRHVSAYSVKCPCCGTLMAPKYLCYSSNEGVLFCKCSMTGCGALFLLEIRGYGHYVMHNHPLAKEVFSDDISNVSPMFCKIYNEAYAAEQMSLMEVCGVGYRKALEFLIKDYSIQGKSEEVADRIKKTALAKCIDDYVDDVELKAVAKRAVWLGNDETHYVRKWEDKDVQDLKGVIRLTILWIEKEKETERLLAEMPEGR
jgi:hypothetical protein